MKRWLSSVLLILLVLLVSWGVWVLVDRSSGLPESATDPHAERVSDPGEPSSDAERRRLQSLGYLNP